MMVGLQCYGERIALVGLSPEELAETSRLSGFPWTNFSPGDASLGTLSIRNNHGRYSLSEDGAPSVGFRSLRFFAEILKARIIGKLAASRPELLFLRGDTVQTPQGQAILIAGPSITGKTRLAQAFIQMGCTSWSSHVSVVNSKGELLAFPSLDQPHSGLTPIAIAVIAYESGAELTVESLSPGQAVLQLTSAQLLPSENQGEVFTRLGQAASAAKVRYAGQRGESAQASDFLYQLVSA